MSRWQTRLYALHFLYLQPAWRTAEPIVTATIDHSVRFASCAARCLANNVPKVLNGVNRVVWPAPALAPANGENAPESDNNVNENPPRDNDDAKEKVEDSKETKE